MDTTSTPISTPMAQNSADMGALTQCPLCHNSAFSKMERKILGIFTVTRFTCTSCGTVFKKFGEGHYVLLDVSDKNKTAWTDYGNKSLTCREWITIGNGGMSDVKQHEADMETWMGNLREGKVSVNCVNAPNSVILKKDEKVIVALPNITLKESRSVRVSSGSYGGPSFRVAKGVYFHVGGFGSTSQSHGEIKDIDRGVLTITNQRFVFSGGMKSVDVPLRKVTGLDPFSDGVALHREGYQKTQYFVWRGKLATLNIGVSGRQYQEELSGLVLKYLIEGAVHTA